MKHTYKLIYYMFIPLLTTCVGSNYQSTSTVPIQQTNKDHVIVLMGQSKIPFPSNKSLFINFITYQNPRFIRQKWLKNYVRHRNPVSHSRIF